MSPEWGPYFAATPADQSSVVTTLSLAAGGKAIMSQQTAVELSMAVFGRAGTDEWARVQQKAAEEEQKQLSMFADADGSAGGKVTHTAELPSGATVKRTFGGGKPPPAPGDTEAAPGDKPKPPPAE